MPGRKTTKGTSGTRRKGGIKAAIDAARKKHRNKKNKK